MLRKSLITLFFYATLLAGAVSVEALAQEVAVSAAPAPAELMSALPASEMVMTIDMRRIMDEALPRMLINAPLAQARMNAELAKVQKQTGFDLRSIDRIVMGLGDFNLNAGESRSTMPGKLIAIATGSFNAPVLIAAARLAAGGKYREEQYAQSTLYTFDLSKAAPAGTFPPVPAPEISLASLDAHTLIIGLPMSVRATIDLHNGHGLRDANANLISMASNNPGALIGVGADVTSFLKRPAMATKSIKKLELTPLDKLGSTEEANASSGEATSPVNEITKALEAVRQVFFSVGMAATNFNVQVVARTEQNAQAQELVSMLEAARSFAQSSRDPKVRKMLDAVKVFSQNNEIQVSAEFAQTDVASLVTDKDLKFSSPVATSRPAKRTAAKRRRRM